MARLKVTSMEIEGPLSCPVCGGDNSESASGFCSLACENAYADEQRRRDDEYARDLQLEIQEYPPDVVRKIMGGC